MTDELLTALGAQSRTDGNRSRSDDGDPSPEVAALLEPLAEDEMDAMVAAALGAASTDAVESTEVGIVEDVEAPANDLPTGQRWKRWAPLVPVLIAAGLLLWWVRAPDTTGASLPTYAMVSMDGAISTVRSRPTADEIPRYSIARGHLDLILEPSAPVSESLEVRMLAHRDGVARWLTIDSAVQVSEAGVVRIRGPVSELLGSSTGRWDIAVLVGSRGSLPTEPAAAWTALHDEEPNAWQAVIRPIDLVDED